jgi:dipeptidyl aminopeptidase/acylaminoacyl peptidase
MSEKRSIEQADLFRFKFMSGAKLSPDGKSAVYVLSHVDDKEVEYSALWIVSVESGVSRQLTAGTARDFSPEWSPDGKKIAFLSSRGGIPQVYIIPVDGGEASVLTSVKQGVSGGPVWSPDGNTIAFLAGPAGDPPDPKKPYRITRSVYRYDGAGYLQNIVPNIHIIPASGGETSQLTNDGFIKGFLGGITWSPDSKEILYTASMPPDSLNIYYWDIRIVNVNGEVRDVVKDCLLPMSVNYTPDGSHVVYAGVRPEGTIGSKADLWIVDVKGGKPECRTKGFDIGLGSGLQGDSPEMIMGPIQVSQDGKKAYANVQLGGSVQIYEFSLHGKETWKSLVGGDRSCPLISMSNKHLFYAVNDLISTHNLFVCNLDGSEEKQMTRNNAEFLSGLKLPETEHLLFPGVDGEQVEAWYMKPTNGATAPYPTILYIHGGPYGAFGHTFSFDFQMLAGAGFGVLFVNHRASTGYGEKFSLAIKRDWGNLDYKDLMSGVDFAIEKGLADPDKLGCCGLSGGGNLSCWIVGQTDRFKAAVPENPVTNWFSMYGVSDIGAWFGETEMGGKPHEAWDTYAKCSPITYAHRCKTPTLLVQGEMDFRCPAEQSEQFYTVLKANGCIVEMLRLPFSPHGGSIAGPVIVRKAQNEALLDWMERFVMGKSKG